MEFKDLCFALAEVLPDATSAQEDTIKTFNLKVLERQQQANDMVESDAPQKRTGRDEWGEDDGAETSAGYSISHRNMKHSSWGFKTTPLVGHDVV
ncbi:hypothetical protein ACTXT7_008176 [Hymenolepis weldensis]